LGLVGLTAQLFAKASVTQIIIIAENAFDFFLVAVDASHITVWLMLI